MADGAAPKKSSLLIAIGGKPKGPMGGEPDADEMGGPSDMDADNPGMDEILDSTADDIVAAVKSGDASALKEALRDFVRACKDEY